MALPHTGRADAIVVGAGLAGLACAHDLIRAGLHVALLEGSDAVGGRMRTDRRDGFLLDRGFQVFNTACPQVKRRMDLRGLRLRPFEPGFVVHTDSGPVRLTDPSRNPHGAASMLGRRALSTRDMAALSALTVRDALLPAARIKSGADRSTAEALARAGLSPQALTRILRPFLSGVFLEDGMETSARFFHLVWRSMVRGTLCLPADGIGSVPAQLAARLPAGTLRLESPVAAVHGTGVLLADGKELEAATVVIATDAATAAVLLPGLPVPDSRTVTTHYHVAPRPPLTEPVLHVDGTGPVLNTCVISEVAPTYAPPGTALISTSTLGTNQPGQDHAVLDDLARLYATDTGSWQRLASYAVPGALPAMRPPWPLCRTTRVGRGRYVCGDHRATGSVQGALASGTRAAREVLADAPPG